MTEADLDAVLALEQAAHAAPWSRLNFRDSLLHGHPTLLLLEAAGPGAGSQHAAATDAALLAFLVAMPGVDEVHVLNLAVAPAHQRQGWARLLLDLLARWAQGQRAQWLWLEVRQSNTAALQLYQRCGFAPLGRRRGYYPLGPNQREDAVLMGLNLNASQAKP
ncbi:MAG: ribosomal-protein-alanine N-acetyltransferase [Hydrogenophaga sp.]|nr:ribosomal-protein-alanine N-acetyltransferase [Hydrogenophaga sp.]